MEKIDLDIKKIKEEDRRFLLNQNLSKVITNVQMSANNTTLIISILAILLSSFSIIYSTKNFLFIEIFMLFSELGLIFLLSGFGRAKKSLINEMNDLKINYDELFKYHFNYTKK